MKAAVCYEFGKPLVVKEMITSAFMGSIEIFIGIPSLVELYQAGKLKLDELIVDRYPLSEITDRWIW